MKKYLQKINSWQLEKYSIWAILLLASAIRFTGLVKRDFWYDEAFTGVAVKENFHNMIIMIINDVHPPLYYMSLKLFSSFFNYSVYGIRLFSAIFGVLTVWALYMLAKEVFDVRVARLAALLAAISPFAIQYSQEARMYAMLSFFILIAATFFAKALRTNKMKYFLWWGFFTGLSALTHYMGIIFSSLYYAVFVAWGMYALGMENYSTCKEKTKELLRKVVPSKELLAGYAIAFLVFLPWLRIFIHHLSAKGNNLSWVKPASFGDIIIVIQMFLFGTPLGELSSGMPQPNELHNIAHISIRMVIAVLLGAGSVYLMRKERREKITALLLFSIGFMFVVYFLSATFPDQQYFVARYLLPASFFIFIFIAVWLSKLRWWVVAAIFAIYIFLLSLIVPLTNSQGYNEMILHMDKYQGKNFYILNSFDYVISKYYLGADRLTLYNYDWPQYNPSYWAAIGQSLKRTENYNDLRNDPSALIISNHVLNRDNQYFTTQGLTLVDQYKNILIYKFTSN
jgi:uncharacterized membrane protein